MKMRGDKFYICLDKNNKVVISDKIQELKGDKDVNTTFFKLYSPVGYPIIIKVK